MRDAEAVGRRRPQEEHAGQNASTATNAVRNFVKSNPDISELKKIGVPMTTDTPLGAVT
jgi:hypothetical protein